MARWGWLAGVAGAVALWSAIVLGLLLFFPYRMPMVPCARAVGTPESRALCQPVLEEASRQVFVLQTLPVLVAIAAGYVAIAVVAWRGRRRSG